MRQYTNRRFNIVLAVCYLVPAILSVTFLTYALDRAGDRMRLLGHTLGHAQYSTGYMR